MESLKKTIGKPLKSLSKMTPAKTLSSVRSVKSVRNLDISDIYKNNAMNNVALFILLALTVGYIMNKHYQALVFLYVFAVIAFLLCKNLFCALMITIILTNLLITVNFFKAENNLEGLKEYNNDAKSKDKSKGKSDKDPHDKKTKKDKLNFKNLAEQLKNIKM
tara:strand:- start:185 stop:673 length:489 start_codon:yes stop_codon:yes gene_type:complete